ncbi:MAG: ABC-three component system protein [Syntrophobacter sp.]
MPPPGPAAEEANYVRALLDAYGEHLERYFGLADDLSSEADLLDHFGDCRIEFYSAESLRAFSRDTLPPGEFETLQEEIHSGIKDEIRTHHPDGYRRVLAVVKTARSLQISERSLHSQLTIRDRGGICHQLANDLKVKWVK